MYSITNLLFFFAFFHNIGFMFDHGTEAMTLIKLGTSISLCGQYLLYGLGGDIDDGIQTYKTMIPLFTSFFLYDLFYMSLYLKKITLVYKVLIYHHIVLIVSSMFEHTQAYPVMAQTYFVGEFSNIFLYCQYFLMKFSKNKLLINKFHKIETIVYIFCRSVIGTFILFYTDMAIKLGYSFYYCWFPLYMMGNIWSVKLLRQLYKKNN